jgi:hypothetical protein
MWAEIRPISEKQAKFNKWQANVAKAKEAGKKRYAEKQMALWTPEQLQVLERLEKISIFYTKLCEITSNLKRGQKMPISHKDLGAVSFAYDMRVKAKEWGKPLSEKQLPYVDAAYEIVLKRCELLV